MPLLQSLSAEQVPLQFVGPHVYGAHDCVCTPGHAPAPSHAAASVAVPPVHEALRHEVELPG